MDTNYGFDPNYAPYSGRAKQNPQLQGGPVGTGNIPTGQPPVNPAYAPQPQANPTMGAANVYQPPAQGMDPSNPLLSYLSKMAAQKAF